LVNEISLYYDAQSEKHPNKVYWFHYKTVWNDNSNGKQRCTAIEAPRFNLLVQYNTNSFIFGLSHEGTGNRENMGFVCVCVLNYVCETWSTALRDGHRLKVFDNRVLRRIFSPFDRKYEETGENFIIRSFLICNPQPI